MSLLKPQPYLRGEVRLRKIFGIGSVTATRLRAKGLSKVKDLKQWLRGVRNGPGTVSQKKAKIEKMVNEVTANRRAMKCLEGYQVRLHNRIARNALVRFMRDQCGLPRNLLPPWASRTRDPPLPDKTSPHFAKQLVVRYQSGGRLKPPYEGGWKWPHGPQKPTTLASVPTYPDGKVPKMPPNLTRAQRNALIRDMTSGQALRQGFPCECFQSRATCQDFNPSRRNRRTHSHLPPCKWHNHTCVDAIRPRQRSLRQKPARRLRRTHSRKNNV